MMSECEDEQLLILRRFPYLEPKDKKFNSYCGHLSAGNEQFRLSLDVPNYPSQTGLRLVGSSRVQRLLHGCQPALGDSLYESLCNLQQVLEASLAKESGVTCDRLPSSERYEVAEQRLPALGLHHVVEATAGLEQVTLGLVDAAGREHRLALEARGDGFTLHGTPDLPGPALEALQQVAEKSQAPGSLEAWLAVWKLRVAEMQAFWEAVDELDAACWVVDPDPPSLSHSHRRITLGGSVWAQVTLDPVKPRSRPDVKLFGPEAKLQPITAALQDSLTNQDWDEEGSLPDNLLSALGLAEFPARLAPSGGEGVRAPSPLVGESECSVCFETRDQSGALPEETCESEACRAQFHAACLFQWLDALRCQTDYRRIRGSCPSCDAPISCPVP